MTSDRAALRAELAAAKAWLTGQALPFWSAAGVDPLEHLFVERVDLLGRPILEVPHRLMVQCRQIYVFSHATLLGWHDGRALVERALATLLRLYGNRVPGVPYVFSVSRSGAVLDPRQDTYAFAFLLFAFAWAGRLLGDAATRPHAAALLDHVRLRLAHADGGGFIDGLPRTDDHLRQNPQMHLLEALLEMQDPPGSTVVTDMARSLAGLFRQRLFQQAPRALPEVFDASWRPAQDAPAVFEPGHHFEWIWLLRRAAARTGESVEELAAALAGRAYAEGVDHAGAVVEAVGIHAPWRTTSRRCWGTCEALKAAASDFEHGVAPERAAANALLFIRALRGVFLAGPFAGGWTDRVDAQGRPLLDHVPTSTLYHVFLAIAEMDRVFG